MNKHFLTVVLAALLLSPGVTAGGRIEETRPAEPDGSVSVELIAGSLSFIGWDRNEVKIVGTLGDDVSDLEIDSDDGEISIEVALRDGRNLKNADADLEIHLPAGNDIEVEAVSAPVTVRGVRGEISIEAVSGDVEIEGAVEEAEIATVNGDIVLTSRAPIRSAELESVSGRVRVHAALDGRSRLAVETVSGDVELHLPAGVSAEFEVATFSGDIRNDFGPAATRESDFIPAKSLEFSTGSGGARLSIESFSGRISLIKD